MPEKDHLAGRGGDGIEGILATRTTVTPPVWRIRRPRPRKRGRSTTTCVVDVELYDFNSSGCFALLLITGDREEIRTAQGFVREHGGLAAWSYRLKKKRRSCFFVATLTYESVQKQFDVSVLRVVRTHLVAARVAH